MPISVKVPTSSLISALQDALSEEEKKDDGTAQTKAMAQYQEEFQKFGKVIVKLLQKEGTLVTFSDHFYGPKARITFDIPSAVLPPEPKSKQVGVARQDLNKIREIKNALAILKLSEEPFVNATTYKSVAQYL